MNRRGRKLGLGLYLLLSLCASSSLAQLENDSAAVTEFREWRKRRERSLRSETGYLALVGLYWLKDGRHAFGSAPENNIVFPEGRAPAHASNIQVDGKAVTVVSAPDVTLAVNGQRISSVKLVSDSKAQPTRASDQDTSASACVMPRVQTSETTKALSASHRASSSDCSRPHPGIANASRSRIVRNHD